MTTELVITCWVLAGSIGLNWYLIRQNTKVFRQRNEYATECERFRNLFRALVHTSSSVRLIVDNTKPDFHEDANREPAWVSEEMERLH